MSYYFIRKHKNIPKTKENIGKKDPIINKYEKK